ncbi:MAG TPA: CDP-alcohol phosphatidyltransferase family protein [Polyangiaceae bacterium]
MTERFWDAYFRSLKPLEVEEPIDVWVHRPPAYVLARILMPTPVSPNLVTIGSIILGCAAGAAIFAGFRWHLQLAGVLIFSSAVLDCADGQLARLRKSSSAFGRMLDGVADLVVSTVVVGGGAWLVMRKYHEPAWLFAVAGTLTVITILTGSFHTTMYDQFKNVFLRMTHPSYHEGEDLEVAEQRFREQRPQMSVGLELAWGIYFFYMRSQKNYADKFDPNARRLLVLFPQFSERNAAIYRKHAGKVMRVWRNYYGFGSLVFGLALSIGLNVTEYYLLFRLILLNAGFYGYLRPAQRRASEQALAEMASGV